MSREWERESFQTKLKNGATRRVSHTKYYDSKWRAFQMMSFTRGRLNKTLYVRVNPLKNELLMNLSRNLTWVFALRVMQFQRNVAELDLRWFFWKYSEPIFVNKNFIPFHRAIIPINRDIIDLLLIFIDRNSISINWNTTQFWILLNCAKLIQNLYQNMLK